MSGGQQRKPRKRSPNYPALDLETAVGRLRQLYERAKTHPLPVTDAHKVWGYEASSGNLCVAALRSYQLADTLGTGDKRKIQVSDAGRRILLDAPDKLPLLQRAALSPPIHTELWEAYKGGEGLPPDPTIRAYLVFEREGNRFNEDVVDGFIERFKKTVSFAKLDSSCTIESDDHDIGPPKPGGSERVQSASTHPETTRNGMGSVRNLDIPLQNGGVASFPVPMTEADHQLLTTVLNGLKAIHVKRGPLDAERSTGGDECQNDD